MPFNPNMPCGCPIQNPVKHQYGCSEYDSWLNNVAMPNEACEALDSLVHYAYDRGFHELGYDPVLLVVERLGLGDLPAGVVDTRAATEALCATDSARTLLRGLM
jgi:hypothetical protein